MKFFSTVKTIGSVILHLIALAIIVVAVYPFVQWYYFHKPILGVDFFNTVTYVKYFRDNSLFIPWAFKYFWYGGSPIYSEFILTWFFPIALVAKFFPLLMSVKISMIGSIILLLVFTYLACYRLSKHHFFSGLLAVLVAYSANMYGSLTWGGSLPYFANQLFFPFVLWLMGSFIDTGNRGWYWGAILVSGIALLGHPLNAGLFIYLGVFILIFFSQREKSVKFVARTKEALIFFLVSVLYAYRLSKTILTGLIPTLLSGNILSPFGKFTSRVKVSDGGLVSQGDESIIAFERGRFDVLFADTSSWLFILFGIAVLFILIAFIFDRKKKRVFSLIPWIFLAGFSVLHVLLNAYGVPFIPQGWYRAFWHFPITLAMLVAAIFGYSQRAISSRAKVAGWIWWIFILVISIIAGGSIYQSNDLGNTIEVVSDKASPSSAYPEAINLVESDESLDDLLPKLTPEWLDPYDRNWRLYESDAQVNIWWNALFDMPMVRGYIDPPLGTDRMGQIFLTDQAIGSDGLVTNFDYSEEVARKMALYYIDWSAIRYFEGGHVSISDNKSPSSYLKDVIVEEADTETVGLYRLYETDSGKPEIMDIPQYLKYYRFADEIVTPILSVSNAPAVLFIGDWPGYESLLKVLSMNNINSQKLVTAFSDKKVDSFSSQELSNFDAVILMNYRYQNQEKTFSILEEYVSGGGKVLIDTGAETKDSQGEQLAEFFPFSAAERTGLGKEWELSITQDPIFSGVDFEIFSPPIFDETEWKFSYPTGGLKSGVEVLLSQKDNPLLLRWKLGEGTVIWSGLNFSNHVHVYTNFEESKLYVNILNSLVLLEEHPVGFGRPNFENSRLVKFESDISGKGVLFKEQLYDGWKVKLGGKKARAYAAGPAYPGYIYVPLQGDGPVSLEFSYWGKMEWYLRELFSLVLGIVLFDLAIFKGWFVGKRVVKLGKKLGKYVGSWWEKEDDG